MEKDKLFAAGSIMGDGSGMRKNASNMNHRGKGNICVGGNNQTKKKIQKK